jgi:aspartokinase
LLVSALRITAVIDRDQVDEAQRALHTAFVG